ncbi:MAG: lysine--tRNA ligase [Gloeobacterales cyanobacterium]
MQTPHDDETRSVRLARMHKREQLQQAGIDPYPYRFERTAEAQMLQEKFQALPAGEEAPGFTCTVAGRIMARRVFGKLAFLDIQDATGRIQLYCEKQRITEAMSPEAFDHLKNLTDIGDILGATGTIKRTEKGELSVYIHRFEILNKTLLPLPDKWHGLTDVEKRYRQRYVDLIVNPQVRQTFERRAKIVRAMRNYLDDRGFLEIDTPVLQPEAGGADAKPFVTHHNALGMDLYLRIATELHLKRLVVGGFEKVYELGRIFRNEGISTRHNPEFTAIEVYQAYADYFDMMDLTENILRACAQEVLGTTSFVYQETEIDFGQPFRRVTMRNLIREETGVDCLSFTDLTKAKRAAQALGVKESDLAKVSSVGGVMNLVFEECCEAKLIQPTFVMDYPVEISPLAKSHRSQPGLVERFELFIYGREHANAFSELNDPIDQRARLEQQINRKAAGDDEATGIDEDFITALEYGLPPTGGLGIGIDRVVMLLTDAASIREVIAFPTLRTLGPE